MKACFQRKIIKTIMANIFCEACPNSQLFPKHIFLTLKHSVYNLFENPVTRGNMMRSNGDNFCKACNNLQRFSKNMFHELNNRKKGNLNEIFLLVCKTRCLHQKCVQNTKNNLSDNFIGKI